MDDILERFFVAAGKAGWDVTRNDGPPAALPIEIAKRYPNIPQQFETFLRAFAKCTNKAGNAWFFCSDDLNRNDEDGWSWNGFESISLDAADGDEDLVEETQSFWDRHLPIAYAVHSDYAFLAIVVSGDDQGSIVYGYGPEFEESAETVTESLSQYLSKLANYISGAESVEYETSTGTCVLREFGDFL